MSSSLEFPKDVEDQQMKEFAQILTQKGLKCKIEKPYDDGHISSGYKLTIEMKKVALEEWLMTRQNNSSELRF
ncbi:hypothetical protein [Legionella fallonii]|nr:hypothetical protein [Legionella fallonii]